MTNLIFHNAPNELSGYGEPIVEVIADKVITAINKGYSHFVTTDTINADNLDIKQYCTYKKEYDMWDTYKCLLRIKQPNGKVSHVGYEHQHQIGKGYDNIKVMLHW